MTVQRPTHAQLKEIVAEFGMHMSDERIGEFLAIMKETINAYDVVDAMPDFLPSVDYPRTSGHRPSAEENPLNAWYVKTDIKGAPRGPLAGKTIVLKDNVCLAGVPMMNGASTLKGYTPDVDATIVNRILDAGGTIVLARRIASIFASPAAATLTQPDMSITRISVATLQAGRLQVRGRSSPPVKLTWRSAAIRAVPSACRLLFVVATA